MSSFSFNAPTTQTGNTGFSIGAPKFGQTATTPAFGATGFAASTTSTPAAAPTTGFGFGSTPTTTAPPPAFGFGTPTATAVAPTLGNINATSATLNFGAPSINTTAPAATTTAAPPTFGFGGSTALPTSSAALPTLSFGAPTTTISAPTTSATGTGFSFGAPAAATTAPTLTFGAPATSANFAKPTTTTSAPTGLNFAATTTAAQPFGTNTGLFGKTAPSTTIPVTSTTTPFIGLGGVDLSATQPKPGETAPDSVKVKETQVPNEIANTVDALKNYIKVQKTLSSEISRTSTSKLTCVSSEITGLQWAIQEISNSVEANYKQIKLLRRETTKTIQSVEIAQRTQDTPAGLQFENNSPFQYFKSLIEKYEEDLINFRKQIHLIERHMHSITNPETVSPDDLKRCFKQINESFISLAGRLHDLHQQVETQKEQYLNLRKYRLHDATNVFANIDNPDIKVDSTRITSGPTPFSNISAISNFGKSFTNTNTAGNAKTAQ